MAHVIHQNIYLVRDHSAMSIDYQRDRLVHSRERIGRRLTRAAKVGDMPKMIKLSQLLSETQHRIDILNNKVLEAERKSV